MIVTKDDLANNSKHYKKIFFFRICGTGMGAAALLLKDCGFHVEGADHEFYPPMNSHLKEMGISLYEINSLTKKDYEKFDLIIVGNVVPKDSVDAKMLQSLNIPLCSFSAAIGAFVLKDRNVVGIAGTHGKTTTSYFAVQIFEKLNTAPGYFIGGVIMNRSSAAIGRDQYFFIEADEYDSSYFEKFSKFHNYFVNHLILTSLEFDHADIFHSLSDIEYEFTKLIKNLNEKAIICDEYEPLRKLDYPSTLTSYMYGRETEIGPHILEQHPQETVFSICFKGQHYKFVTNVVGTCNINNLASVIIFALSEGYPYEDVAYAAEKLTFVKRRQELCGLYKKALVIDDFAHHPSAVKATLNTIQIRYPKKKIQVIIEFASATARSNIFQQEFKDSLKSATNIAFVDNKRKTSVSRSGDINKLALVEECKKKSKTACIVDNLVQLREFIDQNADRDSIILILTNGPCLGLWESDFAKKIHRPHGIDSLL